MNFLGADESIQIRTTFTRLRNSNTHLKNNQDVEQNTFDNDGIHAHSGRQAANPIRLALIMILMYILFFREPRVC
jgi:hypothetical protein